MPHRLKLSVLPDSESVLRAPNAEVSLPLPSKIQALIARMKEAVKEFRGIGLAAPQVGKNLMLAVIDLESLGGKPFVIINPQIISKSIKKMEMEEGCLSIPGRFVKVKRPVRVEVEFQREDGKRVILKADKILAKVLQHEIDHLHGVLIIDKIKS